jgi:hypothetical protein
MRSVQVAVSPPGLILIAHLLFAPIVVLALTSFSEEVVWSLAALTAVVLFAHLAWMRSASSRKEEWAHLKEPLAERHDEAGLDVLWCLGSEGAGPAWLRFGTQLEVVVLEVSGADDACVYGIRIL